MEQIYTPEEVAEILKVETQTVRAHLRQGSLKGFKVGRVWRVREDDLKAFMGEK